MRTETHYTDQPVCPYCGHTDKYPGAISEEATELDCESCGETMFFERHVSVSYSTGPKVKTGAVLGFAQAVREYGDGWLTHFSSEPAYRGLSAATVCTLRSWRPGMSTTQSPFDSGVMVMAETYGRSWQVKDADIRGDSHG